MLPSASLRAHAAIYLLAAELHGTAASEESIALLERHVLEGDKNTFPGMLTGGLGPLNSASDCGFLKAATVFEHGSWGAGGYEEESQMFAENK